MLLVERGSGEVLDANPALLELLGVAAAALVGRPLAAATRHLDAAALEALVMALDADGALDAAPLQLVRADGAARDCLVSADRFEFAGRSTVFCIVRDVTDALARDAALRAAYDALAAELARERAARTQAEERLQEFTTGVAAELKTPLQAMQGFVGLLRERLREGHVEEALGYGERLHRAAQRMDAMIGALGRMAQLGSAPLQRQPLNMVPMAQEAWRLLLAAQPMRAAAMRIDTLPKASGDRDLVAQVWLQLLEQALKACAERDDAKIAVDSHADARGTWFRIADNGQGTAAVDGIGLRLAQRIVDHHGGAFRRRSAPGVGTVVEFTLDAAAG